MHILRLCFQPSPQFSLKAAAGEPKMEAIGQPTGCRFLRGHAVCFAKSQPRGLVVLSATRCVALATRLLSALCATVCEGATLAAPTPHLQTRDSNVESLLARDFRL